MWYLKYDDHKNLLKEVQNMHLTYNSISQFSEINVRQLSTMLSVSHFVIDSQNFDEFFIKHIKINVYGENQYTKINGNKLINQFANGLELIHLLNYNFFVHHTTLETGYATLFIMI